MFNKVFVINFGIGKYSACFDESKWRFIENICLIYEYCCNIKVKVHFSIELRF